MLSSKTIQSPTEEQIELVEKICKVLNTDFPTSSLEYNRECFDEFIDEHKELIACE